MADPKRAFEVVQETDDEPARTPHPAQPIVDSLGIETLTLGLKALSQRAIGAVKDVFTLLSVASTWWLWRSIPDPQPTQIVSLSLYAVFVVIVNWLVRRK